MASTSRKTAYIVQPFWRDAKDKLRPGKPVRRADEGRARGEAEALSAEAAGVSLIEVEVAEDVDWCGKPRLLASFGEVPASE